MNKESLEKILKITECLLPMIGAGLAMAGPKTEIASKIAMALPGLVVAAEAAIGDGNGTIKKDAVMEGTKHLVNSMATISTGNQKETWESLKPHVSVLVDGVVAGANLVAPKKMKIE